MKKLISLITILIVVTSCSRSDSSNYELIHNAEEVMHEHPDSALQILNSIEISDLKEDSLKAIYAIVAASAHKMTETSMVSDSLTGFAFEYYKHRNNDRFMQAGDLYALHRFWCGDGDSALLLLDSLISLHDVPQLSKIELLRSRMGIGGQTSIDKRNISAIRQLMQMDQSEEMQSEYKHQLYLNYAFIGQTDSALILLNELIDHARQRGLGEQEFEYQYEKIGMLEEAGRYSESNALADYIITHAPESSVLMYLHFWKALNLLNMSEYRSATEQLALADDFAKDISPEEYRYYESFAGHVRNLLTFQNEKKIKIIPLAELSNRQRDRWFRDENTKHLQRQNALKAENRSLIFKSQSERKTYIIVIISLVAFIILSGGFWLLQKRKRKTVEAEERAETLQQMVDELQKPSAPANIHENLRRAMLQQLGIIKMVAETPTEQNREMLRKISSLDTDTNGSLVNWSNVYDIIDNLYSGFYNNLHNQYGDILTEKEEQIIVLMMAGFSTKEIGVITSQTTATIYVRKSSIRKKLGIPEKEDIMSFLNERHRH